MKQIYFFALIFFISLSSFAATFSVNSQASFNAALSSANTGDVIEWVSGTYSDIFMDITKSDITVQAASIGEVIFNGTSRVEIDGNNVTFNGFQYNGGDIGTSHVVRIYGNNVLFEHINISEYTSYKYLIIEDESQYTTISYCNFEHRVNNPDQNILSILVNENQPGFHKVQYCSFKNFDGEPDGGSVGDAGVEPIRIGVSTSANYESKSIVEFCYFTQCNGDGEIISHKATECIYRYNTFNDNPEGELVLRHGDKGIVYSNFFTNSMGGVRIQEGSDHVVYNNYFSGLTSRSLNLNASSSDPLDNILIAYNTFVNSEVIDIENHSTDEASNVTIANNIFSNPSSNNGLFEDLTANETWIGNVAFGNLGAASSNDFTIIDPQLSLNTENYYAIAASSPVINQGITGYPALPIFTDLAYDNDISFDILSNTRDSLKDVGCQEYNASAELKPYVNADNTGPIYLMPDSPILNTTDFVNILGSDVKIYPNPLTDTNEMNIYFNFETPLIIEIELYNIVGQKIETLVNQSFDNGANNLILQPVNASTGMYLLQINAKDNLGNIKASKIEKFMKL